MLVKYHQQLIRKENSIRHKLVNKYDPSLHYISGGPSSPVNCFAVGAIAARDRLLAGEPGREIKKKVGIFQLGERSG